MLKSVVKHATLPLTRGFYFFYYKNMDQICALKNEKKENTLFFSQVFFPHKLGQNMGRSPSPQLSPHSHINVIQILIPPHNPLTQGLDHQQHSATTYSRHSTDHLTLTHTYITMRTSLLARIGIKIRVRMPSSELS